jgi:hypothetical protein
MTDRGTIPFETSPPLPPGEHVLYKDSFADGRYLVDVSFPYGRTVVIDSTGAILEDVVGPLKRGAFRGESVSQDGRLVAGIVEVDNGMVVESTTLVIRNLALKRTFHVEDYPSANGSAFSRVSDLFAFESSGIVHVGRLVSARPDSSARR